MESTHPSPEAIRNFVTLALQEDVREGDHTSLACIGPEQQGTARLLVKEKGILAGLEMAEAIFAHIDPQLHLNIMAEEGEAVDYGKIAFEVEGNLRHILMAERLVLNVMQRMSGIATRTNHLVRLISDYNAKLLDTRKTTPGIRFLEKWAVRIGGGQNHRFGLYDMIMIKDNHVDGAGGTRNAIEAVARYLKDKGLNLKVEIEVRNMRELNEVLEIGGVDRIMLDNFSPVEMKEAVALIPAHYETEASGGITEHNIREYAATGVQFISTSAITHSVRSLDLSLKVVNH